ncbi:MAG: hypothetical protein H6744_20810 [Deltaproteobacteria bacterium]|nr:hypothetical protein [Deltaproteobacteria bacterium]MCB9789124.1 hypothetical protein [Deltaproteobacteria bacterium]
MLIPAATCSPRPASLLRAATLLCLTTLLACGGSTPDAAGAPDADTSSPEAGGAGDSLEPLPELRVSIVASTLTGNAPLAVDFSAEVIGDASSCAALEYAWLVGADTTYEDPSFTHTFFSSGSAQVSLTLTCRAADGRETTAGDAVEVRTAGCADLLFDQVSLDSPVEVAPGDTARLKQGKLFNEGDAINVPFELRVVLSIDDVYDPETDVVVATRQFDSMPSGLFTESSEDLSGLELAVPEDLPDGNYFVYLEADAGLVVNECRETNNVARSTNNLTVDAAIAFKPDLLAESVSPTEPGLVVNVGQNINYSFTLRNAGVGESGGFRIAVYLSSDDALDEGDLVIVAPGALGSSVNQLAVNASQGYFKSFTIPSSLPDGEYYVIVQVDALDQQVESDETNNVTASAFPLTVAYEAPQCFDLALTQLEVSPSISYWNGTLQVRVTVANPGTQVVPAGAKVQGLLSQNPTLNPATATQLGTWTLPEIPAGGEVVLDEVAKVPASIPVKQHYVGVLIDPSDAYPECSEANNAGLFPDPVTIVATASVDLVEAPPAFHPTTVTAGDEIKVTHTLTNAGSSAATPFRLAVALSTKPAPTASDLKSGAAVEIHSVVVPGLAAGESVARVEKVVVPKGLEHTISNWYVAVIADPDASQGSDKDKANNIAVSTEMLTVIDPKGGCFEDGREPDNTLSAAKPGSAGKILGAGSCGNEDWTRVSVPAGASLLATLTIRPLLSIEPISSNIDLDVTTEAGALVDQSHRSGDIEQVSVYNVPKAANYMLRVFPGSAGAQAQYDLDVEIRYEVPGVELLPDDVVALPSPLYPGGLLAVTWTDVNLGAEASAAYSARIWASKDATLEPGKDLALGSFSLGPVAGGAKAARSAKVLLPASLSGGQWRFLVELDPDGSSGDLDTDNNLGVSDQVFVDVLLTCADDNLEPNNGPPIATPLDFTGTSQVVRSGLVVCPELDDWYAVQVTTGQKLEAVVTYPHQDAKGLLRVELWEPTGTAALFSNAAKGTSAASLPWAWRSGTWYVRVVNQAQGTALAPYTYSLAVNLVNGEPAASCTGDGFEPNNSYVQPALIGCGLQHATLCRGDVDLYRVELYALQTLEVTLQHSKGALEMQLLPSADGTPITTKSGNGSLTYYAETDRTVFLRVRAKGDPASLDSFDYTLFMDGLTGTDLVVPDVSVYLPSVYQGEDDLVDFSVENTCQDSSGPFAMRLWLSKDQLLDPGDLDLGDRAVADLGGKTSLDLSQKVGVPFSTAPGNYWVLVQADADDDVAESNEDNNDNGAALAVSALCLPDAFEPNDLLGAVSPFAPLVELPGALGLALCPSELDWYAVQVPAGKALTATIHFDPEEGDLDLRAYDPSYSKTLPVVSSTTGEEPESVTYAPPAGGVVLLRVNGFDGGSAAYDLELSLD